jgi:hypothetical protein
MRRTEAVIAAGQQAGWHSRVELYISRAGRRLVDSSGPPRPWLSAGKPLLAVALAQVVALDERLRALLTHTSTGVARYERERTWKILAGVLEQATGLSCAEYLRRHVFDPAGMTATTIGTNPGRDAAGPIADLGRFYEAFQAGRLVPPALVAELTRRHRVGQWDETFGHVMDWGLGFIINSNRYGAETVPYGFGRYCSEQTYGHGGQQSVCGFCDPAHALVVAWWCDGRPGEAAHHQRCRLLNSAIYEDLGLVVGSGAS